MKRVFVLAVLLAFFVGCATVPVQPRGTVLEKFARGGYIEYSALSVDGKWIPVPTAHAPTYWVSIQGNGCRVEIPMPQGRWDKVNIGDVILFDGDDQGGGA